MSLFHAAPLVAGLRWSCPPGVRCVGVPGPSVAHVPAQLQRPRPPMLFLPPPVTRPLRPAPSWPAWLTRFFAPRRR